MRQFRFAGLFMGDEERIDHPAAGVASRQVPLQHFPSLRAFGPGEQAVAVDRAPQGLSNRRFAFGETVCAAGHG
jgi:hypothetical protein